MSRARTPLAPASGRWGEGELDLRPAGTLLLALLLLLSVLAVLAPAPAQAAPTVTTVPANTATNVPLTQPSISATFDELVTTPTALTLTVGTTTVATVTAPSIATGTTNTTTPTTFTTVTYSLAAVTLAYETTYTAAFSVRDDADVAVPVSITFTTVPPPALTVTNRLPLPGATAVDPDASLVFTFSNDVASASTMTLTASSSTPTTVTITDRTREGRVVTYRPGALLNRSDTYTFTFAVEDEFDQELTVTGTFSTLVKAAQTIILSQDAPDDVPITQGTVVVIANTGSGGSGQAIAFTSTNLDVCTVTASHEAATGITTATFTLVGVGTCSFTATQAGDGRFQPAELSREFSVTAVTPLPPTLAAAPTSVEPGGTVVLTGTGWESLGTVTFSAAPDTAEAPISLGSTVAEADGSLRHTVVVPSDAAPGTYSLTGTQGERSADTLLTVLAPAVVPDAEEEDTTADGGGAALAATGWDRAAPFAFLGSLLALAGLLVVSAAQRHTLQDGALAEDPSGWGYRRRAEPPAHREVAATTSADHVQLTARYDGGSVSVGSPPVDDAGPAGPARRFVTAADIDAIVAAGQDELLLDDHLVLTDRARNRIRELDVTIVLPEPDQD